MGDFSQAACRRAVAIATRGLGRLLSPKGRRGRLAVFCYHQVLETVDPLRPDEPNREEFGIDLEVLASVFTVLPLAEGAQRMAAGTLPARAACITFDDGYANNHEFAAPMLERAGLPATFFVTGGAVDCGIMWNDLAIEAVARGGHRPVLASLPELEGEESEARADHELIRRILMLLKYRPPAQRWGAAERLFRDNVGGDPPRLMMDKALVADLAMRGFDIGGHTMNHPILKTLADEEAQADIEGGSRWIESVTGSRPNTFAYPNGKPGTDFAPRHANMVAAAGYDLAVSTEWSLGEISTDPYRIPRIGPWWRRRRALPLGFLRLYGGHLVRQRPQR